eukprot:TRINITY_DN8800_c0_g1_i1.p1 TRINITY_DN8800_c0_g1~~TRINITY_DN8800_c0_g1_i1.p1  ORF type:complete len:161 (-),score=20.58 TRINITY_DN8800_c0_g1_i1:116-556(-)
MDPDVHAKQTTESDPDHEQNQNIVVNDAKNNNNSEEEEMTENQSFESEDDDTSIDLDNESALDCEMEVLGAKDEQALHSFVSQVASEFGGFEMSLNALQSFSETTSAFLIGLFEDARLCAHKQNRTTIKAEDIQLVARIRGMNMDK